MTYRPPAGGAGENSVPAVASGATADGGTNSVEVMAKTSKLHWTHVLAAIRNNSRMQRHVSEDGESSPIAPSASQIPAQTSPAPAAPLPPESPNWSFNGLVPPLGSHPAQHSAISSGQNAIYTNATDANSVAKGTQP